MSKEQQKIIESDIETAIKIMPPDLDFEQLNQQEMNYFFSILNLFDHEAQEQILNLINHQIIFVRVNVDTHWK